MTASHDHVHDHDTDEVRVALSARVRALEDLLTEADVSSPEQVDAVIELYQEELGPRHGSRLVARAWTDSAFKERLLTDATGIVREHGYDLDRATHRELPFLHLNVVENTPEVHNVIVCTLCSCYPLSLLGPQPSWYKSVEYRARIVYEPRAVLREFGLDLPADQRVRVWDSTAENRYMVLPMPPHGTERKDELELTALVSRDALIGVATAGVRQSGR